MIEYTLMNVLILELKLYCGPDKFYGRSNFGQYDEVNDRAPAPYVNPLKDETRGRLGERFILAYIINSLRWKKYICIKCFW